MDEPECLLPVLHLSSAGMETMNGAEFSTTANQKNDLAAEPFRCYERLIGTTSIRYTQDASEITRIRHVIFPGLVCEPE